MARKPDVGVAAPSFQRRHLWANYWYQGPWPQVGETCSCITPRSGGRRAPPLEGGRSPTPAAARGTVPQRVKGASTPAAARGTVPPQVKGASKYRCRPARQVGGKTKVQVAQALQGTKSAAGPGKINNPPRCCARDPDSNKENIETKGVPDPGQPRAHRCGVCRKRHRCGCRVDLGRARNCKAKWSGAGQLRRNVSGIVQMPVVRPDP